MGKLGTLATVMIICCIIMTTDLPAAKSVAEDPGAVETWFKKLDTRKEKVTKLHFFFHDIVDGPNRTVVKVAQGNSSDQSPTNFGYVNVMDDPLTVGPKMDSPLLGRAQGIYVSSDLDEVKFLMTLTYVFTSGPYNGSSLSILGSNPIMHTYREMAVVGGSGVFRLARGIATAKMYSAHGLNVVIEYHVVVLHY